MTLKEVFEKGAKFAINNFTGEVVNDRLKTVVKGDNGNPTVMCALLFDEDEVDRGWDIIAIEDVYDKVMFGRG